MSDAILIGAVFSASAGMILAHRWYSERNARRAWRAYFRWVYGRKRA